MRFHFLIALMFMVVAVLSIGKSNAAEMGIAVVVNEDAISFSDINQRMDLIIASSRLPNTEDTREKLLPQIVGSLVDEQLKIQEATRLEIQISQGDINNGIASIAQQNNMEAEDFRKMLSSTGVNVATMENQVRAELAWGRVIQARLRSQVSISDNDIDAVIARIEGNEGKTEYLVSEILIAVEDPTQEAELENLSKQLVQQMRAGQAQFFRVAQQFSKAPGAPQGGNLGWIQAGQMSSELDAVMTALGKGEISDPIRTLGGFHILTVRDTRVIDAENIPPRENIERNLGMERLDRLQRRYLLDLKSAAFIENRIGS